MANIAKKRKNIQFPEVTGGKVIQFPIRNKTIDTQIGTLEFIPASVEITMLYAIYIKSKNQNFVLECCACKFKNDFLSIEGVQYPMSDVEVKGKMIKR